MRKLTSQITIIGDNYEYVIKNVHGYSGFESYDELTDKATVFLPYNYFNRSNQNIVNSDSAIFKVGDEIKIESGYDFQYYTRFIGVITKIDPTKPVRLECQDKMYLLKQVPVDTTFGTKKNGQNSQGGEASIKNIVETSIAGTVPVLFTADIQSLNAFRAPKTNAFLVLEKLKEFYTYSYFKVINEVSTLVVGTPNPASLSTTHKFSFEYTKETPNYIIDHNLTWQKEEDYIIKLRGKIIDKNNKVSIVEVGRDGGDLIEMVFYNQDSETVTKILETKLQKERYTGYKGTFRTFITPHVKHGDTIELISTELPERNGFYVVNRVNYEVGFNTEYQTISLAEKI